MPTVCGSGSADMDWLLEPASATWRSERRRMNISSTTIIAFHEATGNRQCLLDRSLADLQLRDHSLGFVNMIVSYKDMREFRVDDHSNRGLGRENRWQQVFISSTDANQRILEPTGRLGSLWVIRKSNTKPVTHIFGCHWAIVDLSSSTLQCLAVQWPSYECDSWAPMSIQCFM